MTNKTLSIWTVYDHPIDFPSKIVARRCEVGIPLVFTEDVLEADSLDELREMLPKGLHKMNRLPEDDPVVIEVWL